VVIFAGGRGARFDAETLEKPKPMIEVAGKPILQHIIDLFVAQGFREFIVPTGYLGSEIWSHFVKLGSCFSYDRTLNRYHYAIKRPDGGVVVVKCWDTGEDSHVGKRLWLLRDVIGDRRFVMTYGDGLSDVSMQDVTAKHETSGPKIWWGSDPPERERDALLTLTAIQPPGRFGSVKFGSDPWCVGQVESFDEKPADTWINGGFMVVERRFIDSYLAPHPNTGLVPQLEGVAMRECAWDGFVRAYKHNGYWRCMDTRRDREQIEQDVAASGGNLPWLR
jgi:glucose-1-phosphate cytidylyltransferase